MARFRFEKDRLRYAVSHAALREILALYAGRAPGQLLFQEEANGKPALDPPAVSFNLTHSGDLALVAVAPAGRIGVDIEQLRPVADADAIAERLFTPEEREAAARGGAAEFFRIWTRKEALVKASGEGLGAMPEGAPGLWTVQSFVPAANYIAAAASEGTGFEMRHKVWR